MHVHFISFKFGIESHNLNLLFPKDEICKDSFQICLTVQHQPDGPVNPSGFLFIDSFTTQTLSIHCILKIFDLFGFLRHYLLKITEIAPGNMSISGVYSPITMQFDMKMGFWALTWSIQNSYLSFLLCQLELAPPPPIDKTLREWLIYP